MKMLERKFAVPSIASLMALINEATGLGFSFKLMVLLVSAALVYAAIEAWVDVSRMKYGCKGKPHSLSLKIGDSESMPLSATVPLATPKVGDPTR